MCPYFLLFVITLSGGSGEAAQVTWRPDTSFSLPLNFAAGRRPCGRQHVHFQSDLVSAVKVSAHNEMESLILPKDGEIVFDEGAELSFGGDGAGSPACAEGEVYYVERAQAAWLEADAWSSPRFSAATPDAQRVPCFDDDVVFPADAQFSVRLPSETQLVRSLTIKGVSVDDTRFKELVESSEDPTQAFILNEALTPGVAVTARACVARAGCPCQANTSRVDCSQKICDVPQCSQPVLPTGNCCPICGGVLEFDIDTNTFDMISFRKRVSEVVEQNGGAGEVVAHVGLVWSERAQVVMVERGEYGGASALAVRVLARGLDAKLAPGFRMTSVSGSARRGGYVAVVAPILVLLSFAACYVWFERPDLLRSVPLPRLDLRNTNVFSRFNNRQNSITSFFSGRESIAIRSSFRNPLFASKRSAAEESSSSSEPRKETDTPEVPEPAMSSGTVTMSAISLIHDLE